jgi:hypothetical protein
MMPINPKVKKLKAQVIKLSLIQLTPCTSRGDIDIYFFYCEILSARWFVICLFFHTSNNNTTIILKNTYSRVIRPFIGSSETKASHSFFFSYQVYNKYRPRWKTPQVPCTLWSTQKKIFREICWKTQSFKVHSILSIPKKKFLIFFISSDDEIFSI